jgi:tetratricopeptide (TPR) repeat protein/ferredoxin
MSAPVALPILCESAKTPIRRSKNGPRRAVVLALVHVVFLVHVTHWLTNGETLSPIEPSESMRTLELGEVNAGAVFFGLAILSTLVFGRFICGWGCHVVALQDLCGWLMKKCGVRPKPFRSRLLVFIPLLLAVYMFIWPTLKRVAVGPALERWWPTVRADLGVVPFPEQGFTNHLMTEGFWDTFGPVWLAPPFLLVCGFATVYFLGAKGFCTYGCPYGGLFGPADLLTPGKIVVDPGKCHQCGHCTAVCTSNVRVHQEIRDFGSVVDPGCMKCLDCVSVCPNGALAWKFTLPTIFRKRRAGAASARPIDTSIREDLALGAIFAAVLFSVRGAYDWIALLFAMGIAACGTFLAWKAWRLVRDRDVRFSIWQFKRRGRMTLAGAAFAAIVLLAAAIVLHTGIVNVLRWRADRAYERLAITKARVLLPGQPPLDEPIVRAARDAASRYDVAAGWRDGGVGLATPPADDLRAALMLLAAGDAPSAEHRLRRVVDRAGPGDELIADLGRVIEHQGRTAEAMDLYARTLAEHPEFWSVREQLSLLRLSKGEVQEAIAEAEAALPGLPAEGFTKTAHARTRLTLARLYAAQGRGEEALTHIAEAAKTRPEDPLLHENVAAMVVQVRGDLPLAIAAMRRAVDLDPVNLERRLRLGRLQLEAERVEDAVGSFLAALARNPGNEALREEVARLLESFGRGDEARRIRERGR